MNRQERRKVLSGKLTMMTPTELANIRGSSCAWRGCCNSTEAHPANSTPLPKGWRYLLAYYAPKPHSHFDAIPAADVSRDAVLCPEHASQLEFWLKDILNVGSMPAQGRA